MSQHTHRHEQHTGDIFTKLNWLRAAVLGANDGIISIAALVVGIAGAAADSNTILVTGIAGLLAGAFSMAAGEYVSVSSQRDTEKALLEKEKYELEHFKESEFEELKSIYQEKGLQPDTAHQVAHELTEHDAFAAHAEVELGIDPKNLTNPGHAGIASAVSYTVGGVIPLIAILLPAPSLRISATFLAVLIALVLTGILSARVTGASPARTVARVVVGGMLAMTITYGIGKLFDVSV